MSSLLKVILIAYDATSFFTNNIQLLTFVDVDMKCY